ncbi:MAG: hypothetical protein EOM69_02965 [Clostridia bacterium]|nr:hypothetical protein [Clostridia bacterium]
MTELLALREQLDAIDAQLGALLARRFAVTDRIGVLKRETNAPVRDEAREQAVLARAAQAAGADYAREVRALYERLLELSRARQEAMK